MIVKRSGGKKKRDRPSHQEGGREKIFNFKKRIWFSQDIGG